MPIPALKPMEAYLWNPRQWQGSRRVGRMGWAERGLYRELMDECYLKGSIPETAQGVADMLDEDLATITPLWERIQGVFLADPDVPGHVFSPTVEAVRAEQDAARRKQADRRKGGTAPAPEGEEEPPTADNPGEPRSTPDNPGPKKPTRKEGRKEGSKEKNKQSSGGQSPPPREVPPSELPAAAPDGAKPEKAKSPAGMPPWLAADLNALGVGPGDQAALARRWQPGTIRAALVQVQRQGAKIRKPAAVLMTKTVDLAREGFEFLGQQAAAALKGAPGALRDPRWLALPEGLQLDLEIQAAWAVHLAAQDRVEARRRETTPGEFDSPAYGRLENALDAARIPQAQLVGLLAARASPPVPAGLVNGAVLAHFGLGAPGPRLVAKVGTG